MYIVVGPESSGNRYLVKFMIESGDCFGQSGHNQPFDIKERLNIRQPWSHISFSEFEKSNKSCGVLHRSMPHGGEFVDLVFMISQASSSGYHPHLLMIHRSDPHVILSQIRNHHTISSMQSMSNIDLAWRKIFEAVVKTNVHYNLLTYELLQEPYYINWLMHTLEFEHPNSSSMPRFTSQNDKYHITNHSISQIFAPLVGSRPLKKTQMDSRRNYTKAATRNIVKS